MAAKHKSALEDLNNKGEFVRKDSVFRNFITADGSSGFKAEPGRYHLYVSYACPWAHRTLIFRNLKGLQDVISVNVVDYFMGSSGWIFSPERPGCTEDSLNACSRLREIYALSRNGYNGRVTVPVLFDRQTNAIVNNESSEIIRMFNTEFNAFCKTKEQANLDLYPDQLKAEIDDLNSWIYPMINNGVYRAGFATKQAAYDIAVKEVFEGLDKVEAILCSKRYLTGDQITEADIRLFTTLIRFDHVYHGHFKCNRKMIMDYPNVFGYTKDLYQIPGIGETVNMFHITHHYMESHDSINPHRIVAIGPNIDFNTPHGRAELAK